MKNLKFDTGVVSYRLGSGVLRFNPADPNVYARFQQALEKLRGLEEDMAQKLQNSDVLTVMAETDRALKDTFNWVFGPGNDFDAICGGVNLLSAGADGQRVVNRLFEALEPVLLDGARRCAGQAVEKANARRSAQ